MTDEPIEGGHPTEVAPPSEGQPNPVSEPSKGVGDSGFQIPEKYKDKAWYSRFEGKTLDDFFESFDQARNSMGAKYLPPDFENASEAEIERWKNSQRPADPKDYAFDGISDEEREKYGQLFHKHGANKAVAEGIFKDFMADIAAQKEVAFSEEGMHSIMKEQFGPQYTETIKEVGGLLKKHGSQKAQQVIDNTFTNAQLGALYEVINSLKESYGAKEGDAIRQGSTPAPLDVNKERARIQQELMSLSKDPMHTQEQKSKLVKQLMELGK